MKKIIMAITIASVFAACNSDRKGDLQTNKIMLSDTSVNYKNNVSSDTGTALQKRDTPSVVNKNLYPNVNSEKKVSVHTTTSRNNATTTSANNNSVSTGNAGTTSTTTQIPTHTATPTVTTTTTATKNKGLNNTTKDAVIGGAVGAVGGAIISKHKGKGAIIGGLAGAAGGFILGKKKDKKDTISK